MLFLDAPDEHGSPWRELLEGMARRSRDPERKAWARDMLQVPPLPDAGRYLWEIYLRLRRRKRASVDGVFPVEWGDIDAFARLTGTRLTPWDVELLEAFDDLFLMARAGQFPEPPNPEPEA